MARRRSRSASCATCSARPTTGARRSASPARPSARSSSAASSRRPSATTATTSPRRRREARVPPPGTRLFRPSMRQGLHSPRMPALLVRGQPRQESSHPALDVFIRMRGLGTSRRCCSSRRGRRLTSSAPALRAGAHRRIAGPVWRAPAASPTSNGLSVGRLSRVGGRSPTRHASERTRFSGWRSSPARASLVHRDREIIRRRQPSGRTMPPADLTTRRRSRPSWTPRACSSSRAWISPPEGTCHRRSRAAPRNAT